MEQILLDLQALEEKELTPIEPNSTVKRKRKSRSENQSKKRCVKVL